MGTGANTETPGKAHEASRGLFANRDFLIPYVAETQSIGGDQVGRVALSVLVFDRTGSPAWTALTYALTYIPAILGGFLLGGIGDRFPRVWVMVAADVARAALFVGVAIPGVPLAVVVALVAVAFFLGPAFTAAMVSRLAAVLVAEDFRAASGIRMISSQTVQVGGFAVGGVIVAAISPRAALLVNAATFAASALAIGVGLGARTPAAAPGTPAPRQPVSDVPRLLGDPVLRRLMLLTTLAAFFVVPEGLAVPVAHTLHGDGVVSGLLLAAGPLGSAVGAALLLKLVPPRNGMTVAGRMAVLCGVPLLFTALAPPWPVVFVCWAISGSLWAYQVDVAAALVHAVSDAARSTTIARASAILLGAQGLGLIAFGALGSWLGVTVSVALAGLAGCVSALGIAVYGPAPRSRTPVGRHARVGRAA